MADVAFVVVGDVMTDVVVQASGPIRVGSDTSAAITTHGGGAGANTAAWLAFAQVPTALVGRVGADPLGRGLHDELAEAGILDRLGVDPLLRTGTCVVLVSPDGERTMLPDAGANDALAPNDLPDELFAPGRHLHLSGYTLLKDGARLAGLAALDLARRRGMTTSVDPASSGPLRDVGAERFLSWIEGTDLVLANESEVEALTGERDPLSGARVLSSSFAGVVVKLGAAGAVWLARDGEPVHGPAVAVDVVDTTGAGDAFAAGFLPTWRDGEPPGVALAAGNRMASAAVARVGARP